MVWWGVFYTITYDCFGLQTGSAGAVVIEELYRRSGTQMLWGTSPQAQ